MVSRQIASPGVLQRPPGKTQRGRVPRDGSRLVMKRDLAMTGLPITRLGILLGFKHEASVFAWTTNRPYGKNPSPMFLMRLLWLLTLKYAKPRKEEEPIQLYLIKSIDWDKGEATMFDGSEVAFGQQEEAPEVRWVPRFKT